MYLDLLTADARSVQGLLNDGKITSAELVKLYIAQIHRHDGRLHAMIQTAPIGLLMKTARYLDNERAAGMVRGPLHGIPIIIKDNIAIHPCLGLPTSAGSFALINSKPRKSAKVVDQLIDAGIIILGKANLSEFSNARGSDMPSGWSGVGGQTQSAYVWSGLDPNDSRVGHSNPGGSSSGSAVAVSAGYAPFSIGTETNASLICPAGRASLYTIKPTLGLVSQEGIIPISKQFDTAGPMAKSTYDVAALLDVLTSRDESTSFTTNLSGSWSDISIAAIDPEKWRFPEAWVKPIEGAEAQIAHAIRDAYSKIAPCAKRFINGVDLINKDSFVLDGQDSEYLVVQADLKRGLDAYLEGLEESQVRSLKDLIEFNDIHSDLELPSHHPRQDKFIQSQGLDISPDSYNRHLNHLKTVSTTGVELIFKSYGVNVIIGPSESALTSIAAYGGYPLCGMPLGYLDCNGRPFGVSALADRNQDSLLVEVMSAWEKTFPKRKPPSL